MVLKKKMKTMTGFYNRVGRDIYIYNTFGKRKSVISLSIYYGILEMIINYIFVRFGKIRYSKNVLSKIKYTFLRVYSVVVFFLMFYYLYGLAIPNNCVYILFTYSNIKIFKMVDLLKILSN